MTAKKTAAVQEESILLQRIKVARKSGTPIIAISTMDALNTISTIHHAFPDVAKQGGNDKPVAKIQWDVVRGVRPVNDVGSKLIHNFFKDEKFEGEPSAFLAKVTESEFPSHSMVFILNAHRFFESTSVLQAILNTREVFKADMKTLILLAPEITLPIELAQDVIVLDEPLPDRKELLDIIVNLHEENNVPVPTGHNMEKIIDAIQGLSVFTAEQVIAMSLRKTGVDINEAWERKKKMIENTPGLSVWRGGETFTDVGGVQNVKDFMKRILEGRSAPNAIVFIDEIEKAFAGLGQNGGPGDSSGVTQDFLGTLLSYMQDQKATGMIFIGPAGSAKSMVAKAAGSVSDIPTIAFDIAGMKGSLVGQSEQNLRQALKTVTAVSNKNALFIATCNSIQVLPPELRRRFKLGTFFFDLPTKEERNTIWDLYLKKYEFDLNSPRPNDTDWTGAEIAQCCDNAYRLDCDLIKASKFIVPVARSAENIIKELRRMADGRFISASYEGFFQSTEQPQVENVETAKKKRQMAGFEED